MPPPAVNWQGHWSLGAEKVLRQPPQMQLQVLTLRPLHKDNEDDKKRHETLIASRC